MRAHEKYNQWGALAKCDLLFAFVQEHVHLSVGHTSPDLRTPFDVPGSSLEKSLRKRDSDNLV